MTSFVRDIRHGARGFVKSPGFTLTAVLSLALGIGANSALFGMFNSLLWKPLPVEAPDELVFTLVLAVLAAVAFGLVPALRASRPDLVLALKDGAPAAARGGRRLSLTNVLVVAQVATSLVLLVAAGLFVKSVGGARTIDPGFSIENRIVMSFNPRLQHYDTERTATFYQRLGERVRALAMVEDATLAQYVPLDFGTNADDFVFEGREAEPGHETTQVMYAAVD